MKSYHKNLVRFMFLMALIAPIAWLAKNAYLNYTGVCLETGERANTDDLIQQILETVFYRYKDIRFVHSELPPYGSEIVKGDSVTVNTSHYSGIKIKPEQLILYESIEQFRKENPDCCSFDKAPLYGEVVTPQFTEKIWGYSLGHVNVKYWVKFHNADGSETRKYSAVSFNFDTCGRSISIPIELN